MTVSRYSSLGQSVWSAPDGTQVSYLNRRLLPATGSVPMAGTYTVRLGDRVDTIAAALLGDGTLSWMLADACLVMRPTDLSVPGRIIPVPSSGTGMSLG
jgi:hypothetical protein